MDIVRILMTLRFKSCNLQRCLTLSLIELVVNPCDEICGLVKEQPGSNVPAQQAILSRGASGAAAVSAATCSTALISFQISLAKTHLRKTRGSARWPSPR